MSVLSRIATAWSVLWRKPVPEPFTSQEESEEVVLRRELAEVRLELMELQNSLKSAKKKTVVLEKEADGKSKEAVAVRMESLFEQLAGPLSQLQMQDALIKEGKELGAKEVLPLVRNIVSVLERSGVEPIGKPGESARYDEKIMSPLDAGEQIGAEESVAIRFVGYRFENKILRKALVERKQ